MASAVLTGAGIEVPEAQPSEVAEVITASSVAVDSPVALTKVPASSSGGIIIPTLLSKSTEAKFSKVYSTYRTGVWGGSELTMQPKNDVRPKTEV